MTTEFILRVPNFARWVIDSSIGNTRYWEKVTADAGDVKAVRLLIAACPPYKSNSEGVSISSFYVTKNAIHETGSLNLPVKPLISGYGIGAYGRNGLTSIPQYGTRFSADIFPYDGDIPSEYEWVEDRPLSEECDNCESCVKACPTHALDGTGRVDVNKCLRAQAQYQEPRMPDASREMIGASMWGCDICQNVCKRNRGIEPVDMPEPLADSLNLKRILSGDMGELGKLIGTNYARPSRMKSRACLVAANLKRYDLMPDIEALSGDPFEPLRDCAIWALNRLRME